MKNLILLAIIAIIAYAGYLAFQKDSPISELTEPERTGSSKITKQQAVENVKNLPEVQDYLKEVPNGKVEMDNEDAGEYNVHVYEVKNGHTATFNWYRVSIKDGKVQSQNNETSKEEIKGVPAPVSEFMDNKDITKLETGGLSVNKGNSPPNIEGTYKADNFVATYVSLVREKTIKVGETISTDTVTFSNQKEDGSISFGTSSEGFESQSTSVSGKDNCFTVYDDENYNKSSCKYTLAFVVSGCKSDKGLTNIQISSLMKSKTGEGCDDFAPIGYTIVGKEEDGLMEKINQ